MHEKIIQIGSFWGCVRLCSESCNTLFVDVHPHRVDSVEQHVNSEIVLEIIYQVRLIQVVLHNESSFSGAIVNYLLTVARQVNALALRETFWLYYVRFFLLKRFARSINKLFSKISSFLWDQPSLWKKFVLCRESSLHFHQVSCQIVLPCHNIHSWVLIDFLIWLHFG